MLPPQCHTSVLDHNDFNNYKPFNTCWEVDAKSGCCWIHIGCFTCVGDLDAVKHFRRTWKYLTWRVRANSDDKWRIIRFK